MTITYTCKFCRQDRQLEYDPEPGTPELEIAKWQKILTCNRCADFQNLRLNCEAMARAQAESLLICRRTMQVTSARLAEVENRTRENLVWITKRWAKAVCDYIGMVTMWEPDFVEQILAKPENAVLAMRWYMKNVQKFYKA